MSNIIEMKIISGRSSETLLKEAKNRKELLIICKFKYDNTDTAHSFESWLNDKLNYHNPFNNLPDVTSLQEERKKKEYKEYRRKAGLEPLSKEISIEDQTLRAISDGWTTKGEITWGDGIWNQTLVKYSNKKAINLDFLSEI